MTCTERADGLSLWEEASEDEKKPSGKREMHELLHELVDEKYGGLTDETADRILATMNDKEYKELWMEALKRLRKRKQPALELQVYS